MENRANIYFNDEFLLRAFLQEMAECLEDCQSRLTKLDTSSDRTAINELFRRITRLQDLCGSLEERVKAGATPQSRQSGQFYRLQQNTDAVRLRIAEKAQRLEGQDTWMPGLGYADDWTVRRH